MKQLPSLETLRDWIAENPAASQRDIAKAFAIKGGAKIDLKAMLRELEHEGAYSRRKPRGDTKLPPVTVVQIIGPDDQGDLFARPLEWRGQGAAPRLLFLTKPDDPALGAGDRVLARIDPIPGPDYDAQARLMRKLGTNPERVLGVYRAGAEGGRIVPIDKGDVSDWRVGPHDTGGAQDGELVQAEPLGRTRFGPPRARIVERLGDPTAPRAVSLIAIHQHGIRDVFSDAVIAEADAAQPLPLGDRLDLRDLGLLTIDPWDARDHDDAVFAVSDPDVPGGYVLWVAIADVAAYVRPGSQLDREARRRGNSTYFPDRVVPMLPDVLSGDLCSLHDGVERPCIALRMRVDADGNVTEPVFHRAMMRSEASLTYEQAQAAFDGRLDDATAPLADTLRALHGTWAALMRARARRAPLDLDLPERQIVLSDEGRVTSVAFKERLDAHKVIEEFMIAANVAAAQVLRAKGMPLLYRVHEEPSPEKLEGLRDLARESGLVLAKGQVLQTRQLNRLLEQAEGTEFSELINMATLRAMTQAYYAPGNLGHFGLALREYAHFTSPIRRYADLIVHRALISAHGWGDDGLSPFDRDHLGDTAKAISEAERRSMAAERDTVDRYLAAFLADRVGADFAGRVSGVARFGLFVKLDDTGADGLVPIRALGDEYFRHDPETQTLTGERSGFAIGIGQRVRVKLAAAEPVTGGLSLELLEVEGNATPRLPARRGARKISRPGRGKDKSKAKRR